MNGTVRDKKDDSSSGTETTIGSPIPLYSSMNIEEITNYALQFLSEASPEAIVGVAVSLTTLTYFILGRIGLMLIGGLAGILLHANWEARNTEDHMSLRREKSIDVVKRILDIRQHSTKNETYPVKHECNFETFQPETAAALRELVDAVIRDYVKWWYQKILPKDTTFVAAVRQCLLRIILSISFHLSKKRPEDVFLDFLTNSSSIIIVFLGELSAALTLSPGSATEAVHSYLFTNPESSLANALDEQNQKKKLKMTSADILKSFVEKSVLDCDPLRVFLTEILSSLVLESALKACSKPEWINGWIVFLLEKGESDLSQVIDAGMDKNQQDLISQGGTENLGHAGPARNSGSIQQEQQGLQIHNPSSRVDDPMDEAFEEAKRLSELIAEDEAKKKRSSQILPNPIAELSDVPEGQTNDNVDLKKMRTNSNKLSSKNDFKPMITPEAFKVMDAQNLNLNSHEKPRVLSGSQEPSAPFNISHSNSSLMRLDQMNMEYPLGNRDSSSQRDRKVAMMTLHNANVTIYDNNSTPEKGKMRSKPSCDYLIQIEPASSSHPGWMIVRRYPDFETLHEVLRRIAQISGIITFTEQHQNLPSWKDSTKETLRIELERYLQDACWYQPLAESEGMKRFFKKDQENQISGSKNGFPGLGWSTPSAVGKGMLDALTGAPKGVAEGSKAISGVFNNIGNLGQKKPNGTQFEAPLRRSSTTNMNSYQVGRVSEDSYNSSSIGQIKSNKSQLLEQRPGYDLMAMETDLQGPESSSTSTRSSVSGRQSSDRNRDSTGYSSQRNTANSSPIEFTMDSLNLPPPPTEMPDDYCSRSVNGSVSGHSRSGSNGISVRTTTGIVGTPRQKQSSSIHKRSVSLRSGSVKTRKNRKVSKPLTEAETRVAVELIFAVINEMYTISSAWNIRRTLLTAAKTYFLRPGNPSLLQIQSLIQESVISVNTSDEGIAAHLHKIRENCFPTEDELKKWSTKMTSEDKEKLRIKARRLLITRGVPTALTGVMGQAATSEAMGHIFDCLQIEEVTRGLIFGVLLQGIRAVLY